MTEDSFIFSRSSIPDKYDGAVHWRYRFWLIILQGYGSDI